MTLAMWSLAANVAMVAALLFIVVRAKSRIVDEKLATFAGALNVLTYSLAPADGARRWERTAFALKGMLGEATEEEISWRVTRASLMRYFRTEPVAADLGEHIRALVLECTTGDAEAERVWAYLDGALAQEPGFEQEPRDRFTARELAEGQMQLEAEIFRMYGVSLAKNPPKLLAGS